MILEHVGDLGTSDVCSKRTRDFSLFPLGFIFKMAGSKKLTQEEEILLQDFSRTVTKKSQALFYLNALMITILPLCEY